MYNNRSSSFFRQKTLRDEIVFRQEIYATSHRDKAAVDKRCCRNGGCYLRQLVKDALAEKTEQKANGSSRCVGYVRDDRFNRFSSAL